MAGKCFTSQFYNYVSVIKLAYTTYTSDHLGACAGGALNLRPAMTQTEPRCQLCVLGCLCRVPKSFNFYAIFVRFSYTISQAAIKSVHTYQQLLNRIDQVTNNIVPKIDIL